MNKSIYLAISILVITTLLILGIRGISGNPSHESLSNEEWKDQGPFELSPERGRFALLYSYVEDNTFHFTLPVARFTTPDLGYINGHYVSLFAPGVSFLVIPGYILGEYFGISQVGTFAVISVFALVNSLLIRAIAIKLGAHSIAATIAGFLFLFATPAFPYAVTLYQHHPSSFLMLFSLYMLLRFNNIWSFSLVWLACAASIPLDYPNLFLMFPIGIFGLVRFFVFRESKNSYSFVIKWPYFFSLIFLVPPMLFFIWFNQGSYGNPLQFSGTVAGVKVIDDKGMPAAPELANKDELELYTDPTQQEKSSVAFFNTRFLLNGLYTHFLSLDRGIIVYAPVILLALVGMTILYKTNKSWLNLMLALIGSNILLYSMWGDPYGGWAFGSRYLIPTYAIAAILIGVALSHYKKNIVFLFVLFTLFIYSFGVNTIGALTSNRNPPKVEVLGLEALSGTQQKYTYARNIDMLNVNRSKSFIFQNYFSGSMTAWQYAYVLLSIGTIYVSLSLYLLILSKEK